MTTGELCDGKPSSTVREGADGKDPSHEHLVGGLLHWASGLGNGPGAITAPRPSRLSGHRCSPLSADRRCPRLLERGRSVGQRGPVGQPVPFSQTPKLWPLFEGLVGYITTFPPTVPVVVSMNLTVGHGPKSVPWVLL